MDLISRESASILVALARESPRSEICGFVCRDWTIIPIPNVSAQPWRSFVMNMDAQKKAVETFGNDIIGIYHSHPGGSPHPSATDLMGIPVDENGKACRYWIIAGQEVVEWELAGEGLVGCGTVRIGSQKSLAESATQS